MCIEERIFSLLNIVKFYLSCFETGQALTDAGASGLTWSLGEQVGKVAPPPTLLLPSLAPAGHIFAECSSAGLAPVWSGQGRPQPEGQVCPLHSEAHSCGWEGRKEMTARWGSQDHARETANWWLFLPHFYIITSVHGSVQPLPLHGSPVPSAQSPAPQPGTEGPCGLSPCHLPRFISLSCPIETISHHLRSQNGKTKL